MTLELNFIAANMLQIEKYKDHLEVKHKQQDEQKPKLEVISSSKNKSTGQRVSSGKGRKKSANVSGPSSHSDTHSESDYSG